MNMTKSIIQLAVALLLVAPWNLRGQVVVGGTTPDPSAVLDIRSTEKGVLLPRLTTAQRDAVSSPATGLTIFNTTTNCLETNLGTPAAPDWLRMSCRSWVVSALDCGNTVLTGSLIAGESASGVTVNVPYTGGNGAVYEAQLVTSTGAAGLTATLNAGSLASGSGSLSYTITGTPASGGTASFALSAGGQTCVLNIPVNIICRAKVTATEYKNFMCYNLGSASTSADPFTPGWEINGGYWQWGINTQAAEGPTATDPKDGAVSGWNTTLAPNGSLADGSKTANDPCPVGHRVPTKDQWDGVVANNTPTFVGTFNSSATNYEAGIKFGDQLMLPVAGYRDFGDGTLLDRGSVGFYWSSTEDGTDDAWTLGFDNSVANTLNASRTFGNSVRCIEDTPGATGALNCSGASVTGALTSGQAASGVSASVPYTGGNGGFHTGQTVASTGVTGLTATLSAGNFASGSASLTYAITGTPASGGTASFALNIGGQTCTLDVTVSYVCRAKVTSTEYKNFMCYNLGSANTSADPFTPTWEINGGYWQWGRLAQAAEGPTATAPNNGAVSGWNTNAAADGSWADGSKTANDPCPTGFRVPTKAQWDGVSANNTKTNVGTFGNSATNYGAGVKFGNELMLPAAGLRTDAMGFLGFRGFSGHYWSSAEYGSSNAQYLNVKSSGASTINDKRNFGFSVRCIADIPGATGALNCSGTTVTGTLTDGQAALGVSASVPYTGGNGGFHTGQTVSSTSVTGLTATLSAGSLASGSGSLSYTITGTPASGGTASFALSAGGQTCVLNIPVNIVCRAKVTATEYKNFMCYNLGSASTSADPFTPSWEINGGYWQWGQLAQAAEGPTATDPKGGAVSGWNTNPVADGSWANGSKTANDPCPSGYRVPTKAQWDGVVANCTPVGVGSFSPSATNYGAGKKFGDQLMLPATGFRNSSDVYYRGYFGIYWSSTERVSNNAWYLEFDDSNASTSYNTRTNGYPVRCIAE
jgi:uncharacterized protein (TIGR02145 family)